MIIRKKFRVNGIVQGVGFRPFIFSLASEMGLSGFILNSPSGVVIEAEGPEDLISGFQERLHSEAPPLTRILKCSSEEIPLKNEPGFIILKSEGGHESDTFISPDVTVCKNCLSEMRDPGDRRYRYPFINCTNCGPRFSIVHSIPYDRVNTSMKNFPLCPECRSEYESPLDRRFHAQPNACPVCGPSVSLEKSSGGSGKTYKEEFSSLSSREIVARVQEQLLNGSIVAVRGIGGFHLAVDAMNNEAVQRLRERKGREEKPFAVLARDVESIRRICTLSEAELAAVENWQRPIVLLKKSGKDCLAPSVAPENAYYGLMLPYSPLHYLLLDGPLRYLVMTSGNCTDEPIAISNQEARVRLSGIADYFLFHNREILQRCDDSIVRVADKNKLSLLRRSRGFVPNPVFIGKKSPERILACGPELKNTIAFLRDDQVFISQHIGDLDNPEAFKFFKHCISHLGKTLGIQPAFLAHDLHPEYLSTKWALGQNLPCLGVQHHHAHLASVLADNNLTGPAIGIILDGTGYGADGTIWGGEILAGDASGYERLSWLKPFRLPGGTMAIKQPWRIALSLLDQELGEDFRGIPLDFLSVPDEGQMDNLLKISRSGLNSPWTSSCGRLFDGVSALLGIKPVIAYEAQAAIAMEMSVAEDEKSFYPEAVNSNVLRGPIQLSALLRMIVGDLVKGIDKCIIAARFHNTLAEMFTSSALLAQKETGFRRVALSGGVYQNVFFSRRITAALEREGFEVITHTQVPGNDGGISLGQIAVAEKMIRR